MEAPPVVCHVYISFPVTIKPVPPVYTHRVGLFVGALLVWGHHVFVATAHMHTHTSTHSHAPTHTHTCTHICAWTHAHAHAHAHTYGQTWTHTHVDSCI